MIAVGQDALDLRTRHRTARLRAASALRTVIERLAGTDASVEALSAIADACERLRDLTSVGARTSRYEPLAAPGSSLLLEEPFDSDVVIGAYNPLAAPYALIRREPPVVLEARFGLAYEGVPGQVHGAHLMAGCDWAMGVAASQVGQAVVTGTMTTRFLAPAPIGALVRIDAAADRTEGRKLFTKSSVTADGVLCAQSEAIFISRQAFPFDPRLSGSRPA